MVMSQPAKCTFPRKNRFKPSSTWRDWLDQSSLFGAISQVLDIPDVKHQTSLRSRPAVDPTNSLSCSQATATGASSPQRSTMISVDWLKRSRGKKSDNCFRIGVYLLEGCTRTIFLSLKYMGVPAKCPFNQFWDGATPKGKKNMAQNHYNPVNT